MFTDIRAVSRWLKSKSCPTTCAVKTGDCVTQNLVQGAKAIFDYWVDFWDYLQVINPQLVIELRPSWLESRLALRFSLNTCQVFTWWLEPELLVVVPVLMAGRPQNSSFCLSKFSTWFRHFFFIASRLVKFLCSSWSQG